MIFLTPGSVEFPGVVFVEKSEFAAEPAATNCPVGSPTGLSRAPAPTTAYIMDLCVGATIGRPIKKCPTSRASNARPYRF